MAVWLLLSQVFPSSFLLRSRGVEPVAGSRSPSSFLVGLLFTMPAEAWGSHGCVAMLGGELSCAAACCPEGLVWVSASGGAAAPLPVQDRIVPSARQKGREQAGAG